MILRRVRVARKKWQKFRNHALTAFPEECIGIFECQEIKRGTFEITEVFPCKNVARNKKYEGQISKPQMRELKKLIRRGEKRGYKYGIYHSHPVSGSIDLSDIDIFSGKIYKLFRLQVVLGIKGNRVGRNFWRFEKPNLIASKIEVY